MSIEQKIKELTKNMPDFEIKKIVNKYYYDLWAKGDEDSIFDYIKYSDIAIMQGWVINEIVYWKINNNQVKLNKLKGVL